MHLVSQKGLGVSAFAKALSPAYGLTDYCFVFLLELVGEKYGRCPIWGHYRCGKPKCTCIYVNRPTKTPKWTHHDTKIHEMNQSVLNNGCVRHVGNEVSELLPEYEHRLLPILTDDKTSNAVKEMSIVGPGLCMTRTRLFLICDNCYWCASATITRLVEIDSCPQCQKQVSSIPLVDN